jgi:ABC-type amino acid transport substrate-binding protein
MHKLYLTLLIILSCFLSSCSEDQDPNTWIVGTSADNPPYEFLQDGQVVGFDIDFVNALAQHLGRNVVIKNMEFHSLLAGLANGSLTMVVAGLSVTPERLKRVDFSMNYTSGRIAVLYRKEDNLNKKEDLKDKNIGAQLGTIWSLIAHDLSSKVHFNFKLLASNLMLVEELKSKRFDAIILEEIQADKFIEKYPNFAKFRLEGFGSSFAIALPKQSNLKKNLNNAIKALQRDGTMDKLYKKWGVN